MLSFPFELKLPHAILIKIYKFEFKPFCVVLFYKLTTLVREGNEGFANGRPHCSFLKQNLNKR